MLRFFRLRGDRRGTVAFETPFVMFIIAGSMFWPISDIGVAAVQYISAFQSLRNLGAYIQYHVPPDLTDTTRRSSGLPSNGIPVAVMCGDTATVCSAANTASPHYYALTKSITLNPVVVPFPKTPITLVFSERF